MKAACEEYTNDKRIEIFTGAVGAIYHIPVFPNVYTVNIVNLAADTFYDCNKTHDGNIVSILSYYFSIPSILRPGLTCPRACVNVRRAARWTKFITELQRIGRGFVLIVRFPDAEGIWEPRARRR